MWDGAITMAVENQEQFSLPANAACATDIGLNPAFFQSGSNPLSNADMPTGAVPLFQIVDNRQRLPGDANQQLLPGDANWQFLPGDATPQPFGPQTEHLT